MTDALGRLLDAWGNTPTDERFGQWLCRRLALRSDALHAERNTMQAILLAEPLVRKLSEADLEAALRC